MVWNQRALAGGAIPPEKLKLIADKVYAKCDAVDGLTDGLIDDPRRCSFNPNADLPRCAGETDGPTCFTASQIRALGMIYEGAKGNGRSLFPGQPAGAEIAAPGPTGTTSGWIPWLLPPQTGRSTELNYGESFLKYLAFGRPNPNYEWTTFNFESDPDKMQGARETLNAADPDLARFRARGGKIVMYFGWADPALNPLMGVNYYERVVQRFGASTTDFFRLYMVPGMFHCGGGVGVSAFDALTPLIEWTEMGTAPESIIGSRVINGKVVRTRPLCPYPQVARYKGAGSIDEVSSFVCSSVP